MKIALAAKPCMKCHRRLDAEDLAALSRLLWAISNGKTPGGPNLRGKSVAELTEMAMGIPELRDAAMAALGK